MTKPTVRIGNELNNRPAAQSGDVHEGLSDDAVTLWHAMACLGGLRSCVGEFHNVDMKLPPDRIDAVRASLDVLAGELCERAHAANFAEVFPAFSTAFDRERAGLRKPSAA